MRGSRVAAFCLALLLAWFAAAPAAAQASAEEPIRATVARWYEELAKEEKGRPWTLFAPGAIDASPHIRYVDNGSAALGPPMYVSLSAQALKFAYEINAVRADASFAKVRVWERGYFYAWAAQKTYERAASTLFVLERQDDGRWLILAHESSSQGIPPNRVTDPMPDLRDFFYATEGKHRDPAKDAEEARKS